MREIKFRAYVRFLREMHEVREMIFDKGTVMIDAYQYGLDRDDAPVMQFTGLTDKNGVEIYEGDILSTDLSRPYLVVEFRGGAFMYQCHDSGNDYYDFMSPSDEPRTQDKYCAVIGNIYQHKNLIDGN